jgi:hypothetical protein
MIHLLGANDSPGESDAQRNIDTRTAVVISRTVIPGKGSLVYLGNIGSRMSAAIIAGDFYGNVTVLTYAQHGLPRVAKDREDAYRRTD